MDKEIILDRKINLIWGDHLILEDGREVVYEGFVPSEGHYVLHGREVLVLTHGTIFYKLPKY